MSDGTAYKPRPEDSAKGEVPRVEKLVYKGDLCYAHSHQIVDLVQALLGKSPDAIVIDLSQVVLIDSSGLRSLLEVVRICSDAGVDVKLDPVSECVSRVIAMSGLARIFGLPETLLEPKVERGQSEMEDVSWQIVEHVATSDPSVISRLREKVSAAAYDAGARGDVLCDIQIAVGEALTNAYKHGSPNKGRDRIQVKCMTCPKAVVIEVQDEGVHFDPDATTEPIPSELRPNGMGIYLMRQAMDAVEFCSDCPGNRVRMIKWLPND